MQCEISQVHVESNKHLKAIASTIKLNTTDTVLTKSLLLQFTTFFFFMAAQHVPSFTHTHTRHFLSHFLLAIIEDLHKLAEELYLVTVIVKVIRPRCRRRHLLFIQC